MNKRDVLLQCRRPIGGSGNRSGGADLKGGTRRERNRSPVSETELDQMDEIENLDKAVAELLQISGEVATTANTIVQRVAERQKTRQEKMALIREKWGRIEDILQRVAS